MKDNVYYKMNLYSKRDKLFLFMVLFMLFIIFVFSFDAIVIQKKDNQLVGEWVVPRGDDGKNAESIIFLDDDSCITMVHRSDDTIVFTGEYQRRGAEGIEVLISYDSRIVVGDTTHVTTPVFFQESLSIQGHTEYLLKHFITSNEKYRYRRYRKLTR